jgi:putative transposase
MAYQPIKKVRSVVKPVSIGIDLGLTNTVTLSNGIQIQGPRSLSKRLKKLARANKSLHRKEKGSKNRRKDARKLGRIHANIANVRRDFTEKLSTQLLKRYDIVGIEDLNVAAMMKSGRMGRSLADASLGALVGALERKQTKYGTLVVQVDRFYPSSQLCRKCQVKNQDLTLGDRIFRCVSPNCQHQEDRDINAARNIHREALRLVPRATGKVTPVERWSIPTLSSDGDGKSPRGSRKRKPRGSVTSNANQRQKSARSENISDQI